jgi:hypothetical protein
MDLNGTATGWAILMEIGYGNLLACQASGVWWERSNGAWANIGIMPPDGAAIHGGQPGILTTSEGTWTFGAGAPNGVDWYLQLNGNQDGWGSQMQITNGNLYTLNKGFGHWYVRQNAAWVDTGTTAPVEGALPTPTAITLALASATIPDNAPAGTLIATANVTMSDGSQFKGALTTSNTNIYAISGLNIVTARALTPADDGTHPTVITASQSGQAVSMEFSI